MVVCPQSPWFFPHSFYFIYSFYFIVIATFIKDISGGEKETLTWAHYLSFRFLKNSLLLLVLCFLLCLWQSEGSHGWTTKLPKLRLVLLRVGKAAGFRRLTQGLKCWGQLPMLNEFSDLLSLKTDRTWPSTWLQWCSIKSELFRYTPVTAANC